MLSRSTDCGRRRTSRTHRYGYSEARRILELIRIGAATANTFEDVLAHVQNTANYIGLGPFPVYHQQKLSPILGLEGYRSILQKLKQQRVEILFMPLVASHQKM
jgi:thiamine monophosphate synthase